jgi:EF hand
VRYAPVLAGMLAVSGLATLDAVPVAAQGKPGGRRASRSGWPIRRSRWSVRPRRPQGGGNPAAVMFQMLDTNRDGVVTKQEFFASHEQRFGAMDTNKDGRLTPEEFNPLAGPPPGSGVPLQQRR